MMRCGSIPMPQCPPLLQPHPRQFCPRSSAALWVRWKTGGRIVGDEAILPPVFSGPLGAVATPFVGRNRRISSNEQPNWNDANLDMTVLKPGQVFELPVLNAT